MIAALRNWTDQLLGRGAAAITVPMFDGALKPNQILEQAETFAEAAAQPFPHEGHQRGHDEPERQDVEQDDADEKDDAAGDPAALS